MKHAIKPLVVWLVILGFSSGKAVEDEETNANADTHLTNMAAYFFTTKAYQREAFNVLLEEVNRVSRELDLSESTPITRSNLTEVIVQPPAGGTLGSMETTNYWYCVCLNNQFTGLERMGMNRIWERDRQKFLWPNSRVDTNTALLVATQALAKVGMDVAGLMRDCRLDIVYLTPEGKSGPSFVPEYWVSWFKGDRMAAHIKLFLPTKEIRALEVREPLYNRRKPVVVTNAIELLRQGNAPKILIERLSTNVLYRTKESALTDAP